MTEGEIRESLERSIERHAAESVRQGIWAEGAAREASRAEFAEFLAMAPKAGDRRFSHVVDAVDDARIGETWTTVREFGGNLQFWIDWIWVDIPYRRKGFASQILLLHAVEARRLGADRIGLSVLSDNLGAIELYSKLGFVTTRLRMAKPLPPAL